MVTLFLPQLLKPKYSSLWDPPLFIMVIAERNFFVLEKGLDNNDDEEVFEAQV